MIYPKGESFVNHTKNLTQSITSSHIGEAWRGGCFFWFFFLRAEENEHLISLAEMAEIKEIETKTLKTPLPMSLLFEPCAAVMASCLRASSRTSPAINTRCYATKAICRGKNLGFPSLKNRY